MAKEYITLNQAAEKWHAKSWYIAKACDEGQIPEAVKLNNEWIIPADLERPNMHITHKETPSQSKVNHGSAYKDTIYRMTTKGFPDFNVTTQKIGNTTFIVHSCYSANIGQTTGEALYRYAMEKAAEDCKTSGDPYPDNASQKEVLKQIRQKEISAMPTGDDLRNYYYERFVDIGYTETEIEELMAKIDEHIEKRNNKFSIK